MAESREALRKQTTFNVFLIGSGFTKAVFPTAPLNHELLGELARKDCGPALELQNQFGSGDIEIALTRLDCDISAQPVEPLRVLRCEINSALAGYFLEYCASWSLLAESRWLTSFIDECIKPRDVAISLNYDCLLEGALDCRGKWSPRGGYGFPVEGPLYLTPEYRKSPVTVLKIHGSANFVLAPYADKPEASSLGFTFNEQLFPLSGKNKHFGFGGGKGSIYIIAPSYVKVPTLDITYMMLSALKAVAKAKCMVVIGSSLRPEDQFLTVLITHFLSQVGWQERRLVVVSPEAREVCNRIKLYWGVDVSRQIVPIAQPIEKSVEELMSTLNQSRASM
jgi:hypothetical protein